MKASETKLIRIIEGTNQYLVPHFQRPYTWERKDWKTLWDDLNGLTSSLSDGSDGASIEHFMGAIVTAPAHSVPEGVTKYLLIDGQQRLTTLLLLLAAIRDRARDSHDEKLAARIHDMYLTNRYQEGNDQYKLLPTQGNEPGHNDRQAFIAIIDGLAPTSTRGLSGAYHHFLRELREHNSDQLSALTNAILNRLLLVSIVLERDDNPYTIFESLNAKGQPLTQADLVRNFFFMSIRADRHDQVYHEKWKPMEQSIGRENMEEYIRHFLIRDGEVIKETAVYFTVKKQVEKKEGSTKAEQLLEELLRLSTYYVILLHPERESNAAVRERLLRLKRLKATVCYPFLLKVFEDRTAGKLNTQDTVSVLDIMENFLVRRYVCGTLRSELNKLFPTLYKSASKYRTLVDGVREILGSRNYPLDEVFAQNLRTRKLYGAGEARERAKLILERLEQSWSSKEPISTDNLTIEHIMPQSLTEWWWEHLGPDGEQTHQIYVHTLGNLTLTGYNGEMSNAPFPRKRVYLEQSKLSLNVEVAKAEVWTREEIELRAHSLSERALEVWPNFAPRLSERHSRMVRGATPSQLIIMGHSYPVDTWQEVLRVTLSQVAILGEDEFDQVVSEFPRHVNRKKSDMRNPRSLDNGAYYESNLNAEQIHRLCSQIAQIVGLSSEEWHVETG